jgi:hypothetical protein
VAPRYHAGACGFMCLFFAAAALYSAASIFGAPRPPVFPPAALLFAGILFPALAIAAIVMLLRSRSELVKDFTYDGQVLRFRTFGASQEQARSLPDIVSVRETRGRSPGIGYCVTFRDGKKVYLDYFLPNIGLLVESLRLQL